MWLLKSQGESSLFIRPGLSPSTTRGEKRSPLTSEDESDLVHPLLGFLRTVGSELVGNSDSDPQQSHRFIQNSVIYPFTHDHDHDHVVGSQTWKERRPGANSSKQEFFLLSFLRLFTICTSYSLI